MGKKKRIMVFGFILLLTIFRLDAMQQKRLMMVNEAYRSMWNGDYDEALRLFEFYLDSSPAQQSLYWTCFDLVNQDSNLSYSTVKGVIDEKKANKE